MNIHSVATPEAEAELRLLASVENNIISVQSGKSNIVIVQDSLLGAYLMTIRGEPIKKETFFQLCMSLDDMSIEEIIEKIEKYQKKTGITNYTGKMLFSMLLPDDFFYTSNNRADEKDPVVIIEEGLLLKGAINKAQLGSGHQSIITLLYKEYSDKECMKFLNNVQFLTNAFVLHYGFSVGVGDCQVTRYTEIQDAVAKSFLQAHNMETNIKNEFLRESYVMRSLASARDLGMVIAKNAIRKDNNFMKTILSGAKGDYFNICQITGLLGQQDVNGERVKKLISKNKRTLYHYPLKPVNEDMLYESRGFIRNSFIHGLNPREYWFHSITGREGIISTSMRTSTSGYVQRRMVKVAEDVQVKYDNTVRNSANSIIQFAYGDTGIDPASAVVMKDGSIQTCDISRLAQKLNYNYEKKNKNK